MAHIIKNHIELWVERRELQIAAQAKLAKSRGAVRSPAPAKKPAVAPSQVRPTAKVVRPPEPVKTPPSDAATFESIVNGHCRAGLSRAQAYRQAAIDCPALHAAWQVELANARAGELREARERRRAGQR